MTRPTNTDNIRAYSVIPRDQIANFGDEGDATRQYMLNPALFALLGDVQAAAVLDAGCGQGYLARLLARRGARVTAIEPSEAFFAYATEREQREQRGITYIQADLSTWEPGEPSFDAAVANMVLMDIVDWESALRNCVAALRPGGRLLISLLHPCFEERGAVWKQQGYVAVTEYFDERVTEQDVGFMVHRPLSTYFNGIVAAGCSIEQVVEPRLDQAIARQIDAERYHAVPGYIVIAAIKR